MPARPPDDKISREPAQIRRRLRRKTKNLKQDLEMYVAEGYMKPLEEWDNEELARGRPKTRDGSFRGPTPSWVTFAVQQEAKRRLMNHAFGSLAVHLDSAIRVIANLMVSEEVDHNGRPIVDVKTKFECAKFIIEHVKGKPAAKVDIEGDDVVRQALANALVLDDGSDAHPVIDGQFHEEGDDDDNE